MTVPPFHFGRKRAPREDVGERISQVAGPRNSAADWDEFKAFAVQALRPDHLLASLREHRSRRPDYGYCNIAFRRFSIREAEEMGLDELIEQADSDSDISSALSRLRAYGFEVRIASYDEPGGRDLQIGIKQDDEAELAMRITERLE
ncbi:hypothetical protein V6U71_13525 [Sphingopyxis sp. J-6]|uniref:hypothetical protein n=1 Tax=Sphingopyxis sp. J-6 TaxID=3122054 RepID=UPI003983FBB3